LLDFFFFLSQQKNVLTFLCSFGIRSVDASIEEPIFAANNGAHDIDNKVERIPILVGDITIGPFSLF